MLGRAVSGSRIGGRATNPPYAKATGGKPGRRNVAHHEHPAPHVTRRSGTTALPVMGRTSGGLPSPVAEMLRIAKDLRPTQRSGRGRPPSRLAPYITTAFPNFRRITAICPECIISWLAIVRNAEATLLAYPRINSGAG